MHRTFLATALASLLVSPSTLGGDQDYFVSVPLIGSIQRIDAVTHTATPFITGLNTPFYGFHTATGDMFVPDHLFGAILKLDPQGNPTLVTSGGFLQSPLALIPDPFNPGSLLATDLQKHTVVRVDAQGNQTLIHDQVSSGGLIVGPGGLQYDRDGNLFIANNTGDTLLMMDPQGTISLWSNSPLIKTPGGIAIDGSGNMFVAMYDGNSIVRFRLDTKEAEIFAHDLNLMIRPNDLRLSRGGRLVTTTRLSNLITIDPLGNITELFKNPLWGDILGVSVPVDWNPCSGSILCYGDGLAGTGGIVPRMRGIFSPCPGESLALEWRDFLGGTTAIIVVGIAPAASPAFGGTLLINQAQQSGIIPITLPGSGAGDGSLAIEFTLPSDPALTGAHIYFQTLANDTGAPQAVSMSNGLEMIVGM